MTQSNLFNVTLLINKLQNQDLNISHYTTVLQQGFLFMDRLMGAPPEDDREYKKAPETLEDCYTVIP